MTLLRALPGGLLENYLETAKSGRQAADGGDNNGGETRSGELGSLTPLPLPSLPLPAHELTVVMTGARFRRPSFPTRRID